MRRLGCGFNRIFKRFLTGFITGFINQMEFICGGVLTSRSSLHRGGTTYGWDKMDATIPGLAFSSTWGSSGKIVGCLGGSSSVTVRGCVSSWIIAGVLWVLIPNSASMIAKALSTDALRLLIWNKGDTLVCAVTWLTGREV